MVQAGGFREDLWYRVAVFPILLPRLCERLEDIPSLARHFAERAATRFGLPLVAPTPEDLQLLVEYSWPGNIRELGAVIDRAAILGNGATLEVAAALGAGSTPPPATGRTAAALSDSAAGAVPAGSRSGRTSIISLDAAMRQHIERALAVTQGRIEGRQGAAAILQINPHTLRARMRKQNLRVYRLRRLAPGRVAV
jgi:hydrogenase-4 transcriptional activator